MVNEHSIEITTSKERVFKEVVLWGESQWWPKDSLTQFVNLRSEIDIGTVYLQKVKLTLAPRWHVKITDIKDLEYIRRDFLDGMFEGYEVVSVESCGDNVSVRYKMNYTVRGFFNKFMWKSIFEKLHNQNITNILINMKQYLEKSLNN
ncbi:MAG: hypothetical protein ABIH71_06740 [Candidatus Omnitrophota bacterium]|nr:hypothetical protein [Candidatus Omnitrophota bacterium]